MKKIQEAKKLSTVPLWAMTFGGLKMIQNMGLIALHYMLAIAISTCICTSFNPKILFVVIINAWKILHFSSQLNVINVQE